MAAPTPQLAGEGAAANSIFSGTDNAVGYGTEDAEDNVAGTVSSLKGGAAAPAVPKRQLDKIAKGAQSVSNAAGTGASTQSTTDALVNIDGTLTGGAANAGAQVGNTEVTTLEGAGSAVPKN